MGMSAFEVLGPIMVGPSSSHTAGALRIARVARLLAPQPLARVEFVLYNSFSRTHNGHGTDRALVAGILGLETDDERVRDSFSLAEEAGLEFSIIEGGEDGSLHPNTAVIRMYPAEGRHVEVAGESVGGGRIRISSIDGVPVSITGELPTVFVAHRDKPGVLAALTRSLSARGLNIATMRTFRAERGGAAYTIFESDDPVSDALITEVRRLEHVSFASAVNVGAGRAQAMGESALSFSTAAQLEGLCATFGLGIGELMRAREADMLGERAIADARMDRVLAVMHEEICDTLSYPAPSLGGFLDGQAASVARSSEKLSAALMGEVLTRAVAYGMAVIERSASMGVIVAAPTAGSAGVVPGAVLACGEVIEAGNAALEEALWNAAAIGALISENATVSGAEGGCQAEVGAASAMAASALVELMGGSVRQCLDAASIALGNLLGLVCDPARGMVEYPCQNRNAIGAAAAFSAAQLALSGVTCPVPLDEAIDAMAKVGRALPESLRETAQGGLAACPSVCAGCSGCA